jgi:hypothetical protein
MGNLYDAQDPTGGAVAEGRGPLPKGEYVLALAKSDRVASKANSANEYVQAEFEVMEGPFARRRVWANFNLWNQSDQARDIAWKDFNALCHACGRLRPQATEELHGIPFRAFVSTEKNDPSRNKISSYKPLNAAPAAQGGTAQTRQADPAAQSNGKAPWRKSG